MVRQDIPFQAIHLQTILQVQAVRIGLARPHTAGSIYLLPHNFNTDDLEDLIVQLPQPFLLLRNFSGWDHLWGDA